MSLVCIDKYKGAVGLLGAVTIIGGVLISDNAFDQGLPKTLWGPALFIVGWILVAMSFIGRKWQKTDLWKLLGAILVAVSAMVVQAVLTSGKVTWLKILGSGAFFMLAWGLLSTALSFDDQGKFRTNKALWAYLGGLLVVAGMVVLKTNQKKDICHLLGQGPEGTRTRVYTSGLPMFTLGWVSIILASALKHCPST